MFGRLFAGSCGFVGAIAMEGFTGKGGGFVAKL
jgi:hypothetical protein